MSLHNNMEKFEEILERYRCPKRISDSSTTVEQLEDIVKFVLPADYKKFLNHFRGFEEHVGQEFVRLWDIDEIVYLNVECGIFSSLSKTLAIGTNGGGEFIAIEFDAGNVRIVLSPFIDLDKQCHLEIGTSFSDFLIRLDNGQSWFK